MPLVRLEPEDGAGARVDPVVARLDADRAVGDDEERGFLDLMVAQLLARLEPDQNSAGLALVRVQYDG